MFLEVYYKHYDENCNGGYWQEEKSIPYMVYESDPIKRESFHDYLTNQGFDCCNWNDSYPGILVNTELKRFAMIPKPCSYSKLNEQDYSIDEFKEKILKKLEKEYEL